VTVIPFPTRQTAPELLAFAIGARVDLRVGTLTGGIVRPRGPADLAYSFSNLARLLRAARMAWRERGAHAPLALAIAPDVQSSLDPSLLSEAAVEAGFTRHGLSFELHERELVAAGPLLPERLRANGWHVALRGDPDCPIPFGARARALYSELVVEAPHMPDPFLGLDQRDATPLGRRLVAAKAAGLTITAASVSNAAHARKLAIAGFDRGGGPFAEAGLR
jgi:hypothetical protein